MAHSDPLHEHSGPNTAWSIVNAAEAMPGVLTPLGITFWNSACEVGLRGAFCDLGVLRPREIRMPDSPDQRLGGVFLGRFAGNLTILRSLADRTPGTSGDVMEQQIFGSVREGVQQQPSRRRYGVVALKAPRTIITLPKHLRAASATADASWRTLLLAAEKGNPDPALLVQAQDGVARSLRTHMLATMISQAAFEQLTKLAVLAGRPGLELTLATGCASLEEAGLVKALWGVAQGEMPMSSFLEQFGFHGPDEGEISSTSWREDPAPVKSLAAVYRDLPPELHPDVVSQGRVRAREEAEAELLAALPRAKRTGAKLTLAFARGYLPLREVGKANFLKSIDAGRALARAHGRQLHEQGVLATPDDVFFLTLDELAAGRHGDVRAEVAFRRARREHYLTLRLPELWVGQPPQLPVLPDLDDDQLSAPVTGIPASGGQATGRVRVVSSSDDCDDLTPGEVLVCETTDPSWAAAFPVACAVVVDIGGVMSHGAIVAREFALPCVINTRHGTRLLHTGDLVRVDGSVGTVEVIERAQAALPLQAVAAPVGVLARPYDRDSLRVLQLLRLKGRLSAAEVAAQLHLDEKRTASLVADLLSDGALKQLSSGCRVTDAGRVLLQNWVGQERAQLDPALLTDVYDAFCGVNSLVKRLITDWQTRDGGGNDHTDPAYDREVVQRLGLLHAQVLPVVERAGQVAPRLQGYAARLTQAQDRAATGDSDYVAKPLIDSYHTVWFELHEELIGLCGLDRVDEAVAGRAR